MSERTSTYAAAASYGRDLTGHVGPCETCGAAILEVSTTTGRMLQLTPTANTRGGSYGIEYVGPTPVAGTWAMPGPRWSEHACHNRPLESLNLRGTRALARKSDPATSHAAAATVDLTTGQRVVLETFRAYGPMTDVALVDALRRDGRALSESGARTRRSELVDAGMVWDTGERARLPSGRHAIVWRSS